MVAANESFACLKVNTKIPLAQIKTMTRALVGQPLAYAFCLGPRALSTPTYLYPRVSVNGSTEVGAVGKRSRKRGMLTAS